MPQITDIRPQKTRRLGGARFNIFIDGKFAFGLDAETLVKSGLKINQEISEEKIEKLIKENEYVKVYDRVLKFLSFRPRSEKENLDWFKRKQIGDETKKMVWKKLQSLNYINDEEFARWWIEQRTNFRPKGKIALKVELKQKGVGEEIINKVLKNSFSADFEKELIKRLLQRKLKSYANLPSKETRQKLFSFLAYRGFTYDKIREALEEFKNNWGEL